MKKAGLILLGLVFLTSSAIAADLTLSYTISDAKVDEYVSDYIYVHKNNEVDGNGDPVYTDKAWVREHIMRQIKGQIVRGKNAKYRDAIGSNNADEVN